MKKIGIIILFLSAFLFSCENQWMKDIFDKLDKDGKTADGYGGGGGYDYAVDFTFWFSNGVWLELDGLGNWSPTGYLVTFDQTSITTTNGIITSNVSISGGGKYFNTFENAEVTWAYLDDGGIKIGIAYIIPEKRFKAILVGKTITDQWNSLSSGGIPGLYTVDMADVINCYGFINY